METEPERLDVSALAAQPIAYWTWATTRVLLQHVRSSLARVDVTQQQWWTLNYVDGAENGLTRAQVCARLDAFLDEVSPEDMGHAVDSLLHREWLTADDADRLTLTDAGRDAKARIKNLVAELRSEIHEGITDEEYAAALTILQRMIRNVGGTATPR
ncbi:MarR family winged helix-turn-helix transcriptional regulator [Streptomyces antimycoticus]|uniref:MarR family winged helix-turn-helix transcriptional regulator n=1 Tax=Streptomyces antimycoticus TaxID=68175 RepID=UPI000A39E074|nr:MarR family winged helix-turn-helix transcriptional regulator [Streptomyces antimycoticus]WTA83546.1 MarR family winged helix-turn-helix transcriptional regulator [Streptomyces antimycoticus]